MDTQPTEFDSYSKEEAGILSLAMALNLGETFPLSTQLEKLFLLNMALF